MAAPSISLPALECPDVLLPTPANLVNLFGGLASYAYRYPDELEELKDTLEELRGLLTLQDPRWEKISIPEKEWEIIITRISADFPMFIQKEILEMINEVFTIDFKCVIMGIEIDILEFLSDPTSIKDSIDLEDIDSLYDLVPAEYRVWNKFDTADFKKQSIIDYINSEVARIQNLLLSGGFTGLIDKFDEIWDSLGLPSFPALETLDLEALIRDKTKEELEQVNLFGYSLLDLLGGEFNENVEIPEFSKERLLKRAREFKEEWQTYLIKLWMEKVTSFFDAIGLGALTQWITFSFCDYLKLIGFPSVIDLPPSVSTLINNNNALLTE